MLKLVKCHPVGLDLDVNSYKLEFVIHLVFPLFPAKSIY